MIRFLPWEPLSPSFPDDDHPSTEWAAWPIDVVQQQRQGAGPSGTTGYLYAIASNDLVKIGWSKEPRRRFTKLKADNAGTCELLGVRVGLLEDEAAIHSALAPHHVRGEWYERTGAVADFIDTLEPVATRKRGRKGAGDHPLRTLRHERGLTLDEAARQLRISKGNLSRIETGAHGASDALKRRIADWSEGKITANDLVRFAPVLKAEVAA